MNQYKSLAGQTLIYGLGTIVPRLLNFVVLTPFYTRIFSRAEYGVITELYSYMIVLLIILTYGMETGFFRFYKSSENKKELFSTLTSSLLITSSVFILFVHVFIHPIASFLEYQNNQYYILLFAYIVGLDAFVSVPFAKLRAQNKAFKFALIKFINVGVIIILSVLILVVFKKNHNTVGWMSGLYKESIGVGYVFIINALASTITLLMLIPEIVNEFKFKFKKEVIRKVVVYSFPLLIAGLAGSINEAIDRIILKHFIEGQQEALIQLGIYGANYKLAVFMTLFIQMFKYAAEPFFFSKAGEKDAKQVYADVMRYFIIFGLIIFLGIIFYIDLFKHFIDKKFHEGLFIVPIVLMANLFLGIFYNLSVWYKINDLTKYGALISMTGAVITIGANLILIPLMGYEGCAWAHLICYASMVVLSYMLSLKHYKINYSLSKIGIYFLIAMTAFLIVKNIDYQNMAIKYGVNTLILLGIIVFFEKKEGLIKIFWR